MKRFSIKVQLALILFLSNCCFNLRFPGHEAKPSVLRMILNSTFSDDGVSKIPIAPLIGSPQSKILGNKEGEVKENLADLENIINFPKAHNLSEKFIMNKIPTIGILANPDLSPEMGPAKKKELLAKIDSNYVYWLNSGGSRVVPIYPWNNKTELKRVLQQLNGILIPDDINSDFFIQPTNSTYYDFIKDLLNEVISFNKKNIYYPIFAIGNGLILLNNITLNNSEVQLTLDTNFTENLMMNAETPINLRSNKIKLFTYFDARDYFSFRSLKSTFHSHYSSIPLRAYVVYNNLRRDYKISSYFRDSNNIPFINSIEHTTYPFYAVQFSPEKIPWESENGNVTMTNEAISISQKLLNFFISEARKNPHVLIRNSTNFTKIRRITKNKTLSITNKSNTEQAEATEKASRINNVVTQTTNISNLSLANITNITNTTSVFYLEEINIKKVFPVKSEEGLEYVYYFDPNVPSQIQTQCEKILQEIKEEKIRKRAEDSEKQKSKKFQVVKNVTKLKKPKKKKP